MSTFQRREFLTFLGASVIALPAVSAPAFAQRTPMVGGAAMLPSRTIVENAVNSRDHTTLVAAVQAAGLVPTLSGAGPFTVFAPTNAAFSRLPRGTVQTLLRPENKAMLTAALTYHVVAGKFSAATLMTQAAANGGRTTLRTVAGGTLTVTPAAGGRGLNVTDAKGGTARITIADVNQSNGVIHVVNRVLMM